MMKIENLYKTLRNQLHDQEIAKTFAEIVQSSLNAVDPTKCVLKALQLIGDSILIGDQLLSLKQIDRIFLISIGKAAYAMAGAVRTVLGERISDGIIVAKHLENQAQFEWPSEFKILMGGHPVPNQGSLIAGREIIQLLSKTTPSDLVVFCISGGGSALVTFPYEGITLDDLQQVTKSLLACGASIDEINSIRKHLDQVKGGGLAKAAAPAQFISLVLSDVVGDPLDVIASGPTVPDTTSFSDVLKIIFKYKIEDQMPTPILDRLRRGEKGELAETPKEGDPVFDGSINAVVGSNKLAALTALQYAREKGFDAQLLSTSIQGEASLVGQDLAVVLKQIDQTGKPVQRPGCIIAGGETTVTLHGKGLGGRNLEVALCAAQTIDGLERVAFISLATDGEDGPTDAAGAVVTGETLQHAREAGLNPEDYLESNNTYPFFRELGGLIQMGPTSTNVNDLYFLIAY